MSLSVNLSFLVTLAFTVLYLISISQTYGQKYLDSRLCFPTPLPPPQEEPNQTL